MTETGLQTSIVADIVDGWAYPDGDTVERRIEDQRWWDRQSAMLRKRNSTRGAAGLRTLSGVPHIRARRALQRSAFSQLIGQSDLRDISDIDDDYLLDGVVLPVWAYLPELRSGVRA